MDENNGLEKEEGQLLKSRIRRKYTKRILKIR
jgi:hypothetical protein